MKKKTAVRKKTASPKKVSRISNRGALIAILVIAMALPVTILLVSESQDIRQQAASTGRLNSFVITTIPTDTLRISISKERGTEREISNDGNTRETIDDQDQPDQQEESDQKSGDCVEERIVEETENGTRTDIRIDCSGGEEIVDESGTDGDPNIRRDDRDNNNDKDVRDRKNNGKNSQKQIRERTNSLIQRILDRIFGNNR